MATTFSRNLKLRIDSNLTANAKFNLEKLDLLGANVYSDSTDTLRVRSRGAIIIEPESPDIDGSGVGGSLTIGTPTHDLESLTVYADDIDFQEAPVSLGQLKLVNGSFHSSFEAGTQLANIEYILPTSAPTAGQSLRANAINPLQLEWATGSGGVVQFSTAWAPGDGATKVVNHGLGTSNVDVIVRDENNEIVHVSSMVVTNSNTVTLTSSEVPASSWTVVVQGS